MPFVIPGNKILFESCLGIFLEARLLIGRITYTVDLSLNSLPSTVPALASSLPNPFYISKFAIIHRFPTTSQSLHIPSRQKALSCPVPYPTSHICKTLWEERILTFFKSRVAVKALTSFCGSFDMSSGKR